MRIIITLFLLLKVLFVFSQPQHINQLIDNVLPNFITNYNITHNIDLVIIDNEMPYRAEPFSQIKTTKYIEGKTNGGLIDGYYCTSPSFYLVSKDTLRMQFFLITVDKKWGERIGDTISFYFIYKGQTGKWIYDNSISNHTTWYRDGFYIGDFVKECLEDCYLELHKNKETFPHDVYVIDDYLKMYIIKDSILPNLPHIPEGNNIKNHCKNDDWLIGFPEISFYNNAIAISTKVFRVKDYKNDIRINNYAQYTLFYLYNTKLKLWEICKREFEKSICQKE